MGLGAEKAGAGSEKQFVVFELGPDNYAIDIYQVREIIRMQEITRIPNSPAFIKGVVNIRGHIVPVIDLRDRLGVAAREQTPSNRIVVTEIGSDTVGLVVDAVSEVVSVGQDAIEPPSPVLVSTDTRFLRGIAKLGERLILILDATRMLSSAQEEALTALSSSIVNPCGAGAGSEGDAAVPATASQASEAAP